MSMIRLPDAIAGAPHATVVRWRVAAGQAVVADQVLVELETAEVLIQVRAPAAGVLGRIIAQTGVTVKTGAELGEMSQNSPEVRRSGSPEVAMAPAQNISLAADSKPATPILMPQAGNTMEEGRIIQWRVKVGDALKEGQILCEIETDKSTIEFESPVTGTLGAIVLQNGQSIAVKKPIAYLNDGAVPTSDETGVRSSALGVTGAPTTAQVSPSAPPTPASTVPTPNNETPNAERRTPNASFPASPAARKIAKDQGLDLTSVGAGSGPGGRILSTDLAKASPAGSVKKTDRSATSTTVSLIAPISGPIGEIIKRPLSRMRKAIATNLQQSKQTVPHFYVRVSFDAGRLLAYAKSRKADAACSVNDVVVAGLGRTIHEFPALRSRLEGESIVEYPTVNIGIAVGLDDGLVVPVVMQVERLTLAQLAAETKRVVENARKGKLDNLGKAVFSVSNLGMFGVEEFSAIINPPEAGILAVSAAREAVIVKDGAMKAGRLMTLTLSADHRVVDGLVAAKFVARLKEILEAPEQIA